MKVKQTYEVTVRETSEYWKITKGAVAVVTDEVWSNGEGHYKGYWKATGVKFNLPDVFFNLPE